MKTKDKTNQEEEIITDSEDLEGIEKDEKDEEKESPKKIFLEIAIYIVILIVCIKVIPAYVIQRTVVDGTSMEPNYHGVESSGDDETEEKYMHKDHLLVEKISKHFTDPKRFSVIVFYPHPEENDEYYIKRVIGLPGEKVRIEGDNIYINGKLLEEHYGKDPMTYAGIAEEEITLGDDEFFVLGDNRKISMDSRYGEDVGGPGPVKRKNIGGVALLRIWPLNEFGTCP